MFLKKYFPNGLDKKVIQAAVKQAFREDLVHKDLTTQNCIPANKKIQGIIIAKEKGVVAGLEIVSAVFKRLDPKLKLKYFKKDGGLVNKGQKILAIEGKARAILSGERVALNFLQHLSGIATSTFNFVKIVKSKKCRILDTRKTIPGLRVLEKYAVHIGGGDNHRLNLNELIMLKDNHLVLSNGDVFQQIKIMRKKFPGIKIEIEAASLKEVRSFAPLNIEAILLDNMNLSVLKEAIKIIRSINPRLLIEVSGNMDLNKVKKIGLLDIDFISIGKITHSAQALDLSLQLVKQVSKYG